MLTWQQARTNGYACGTEAPSLLRKLKLCLVTVHATSPSKEDNISDTVRGRGEGGCSETHVGCTLYLVSQTSFLCVCSFYWSYYVKRRRFTTSPTVYLLSPHHLTVKLSLDFTIYSLTYNSLHYVVKWFETLSLSLSLSLSVPLTSNVMGCPVLCVILMESMEFSVTNQGITDRV